MLGWPGTSLGTSLIVNESTRDGLVAQANSRYNWNRSWKCIRLVHKFVFYQQLLQKLVRTTRRTYGYPQNVLFNNVYNTNLIAVVVWSVRHQKPQKYSTWLKTIAETNQLQRCTMDNDYVGVILGGSTKETKFRDTMLLSKLREAYSQIKKVSRREI